ncbi:NUDIX domain-containing protein [Apiospora arundinis]
MTMMTMPPPRPAKTDSQGRKKKVCLLHYMAKDQWLLPKGRRNCRETRQAAAVREVREESGYACRLRPVTMPTRAPLGAGGGRRQGLRAHVPGPHGAVHARARGGGEDGTDYEPGEPEVHFAPAFFDCDAALKKLTFQKDRDVLRRAMDLVETSKWDWSD